MTRRVQLLCQLGGGAALHIALEDVADEFGLLRVQDIATVGLSRVLIGFWFVAWVQAP